jgi:anthranilate/para-aminobenzoate synthase component II
VMGVRHASLPLEGVQFHPESVLTGQGDALLGNWLAAARRRATLSLAENDSL